MDKGLKRLPARFYQTPSGREPVREWIQAFEPQDRKSIGEAIAIVEFGWPVGMPVCRSLEGEKDLWEVRADISHGRIIRILFCIHAGCMVLLHGFIKKTQKTPEKDKKLARKRMKELE